VLRLELAAGRREERLLERVDAVAALHVRDRLEEEQLAAVEDKYGNEMLEPFYSAFGQRFHVGGQRDDQLETARHALLDAGLDESLIDAAASEEFDEDLKLSHFAGMNPVGFDVGTPVIHVGDIAFFGPVVTPAPTGEAAGTLFDGVIAVASTPGFYELKRTRSEGPSFQ